MSRVLIKLLLIVKLFNQKGSETIESRPITSAKTGCYWSQGTNSILFK